MQCIGVWPCSSEHSSLWLTSWDGETHTKRPSKRHRHTDTPIPNHKATGQLATSSLPPEYPLTFRVPKTLDLLLLYIVFLVETLVRAHTSAPQNKRWIRSSCVWNSVNCATTTEWSTWPPYLSHELNCEYSELCACVETSPLNAVIANNEPNLNMEELIAKFIGNHPLNEVAFRTRTTNCHAKTGLTILVQNPHGTSFRNISTR